MNECDITHKWTFVSCSYFSFVDTHSTINLKGVKQEKAWTIVTLRAITIYRCCFIFVYFFFCFFNHQPVSCVWWFSGLNSLTLHQTTTFLDFWIETVWRRQIKLGWASKCYLWRERNLWRGFTFSHDVIFIPCQKQTSIFEWYWCCHLQIFFELGGLEHFVDL